VASRLAAAQAAQGAHAELFCYATRDAQARIERDLAALPGPGVRVHTLPPPGRGERLLGTRARAALAELAPRFDLLHLHSVWETVARAGAAAAAGAGRPYALAPHGMLDPWALSVKPLKKRLAMALGYRRIIRGAAFLHAMSSYEAACLREAGHGARVELIPCGVFLEEFEPLPPPDAAHRLLPRLGGAPYILFLARLHPIKGLPLLAEAFARLAGAHPQVHAVIAGPDYGAGAALREQVGRLGIGERFHIIGPVHGRDKAALFAGAAVFTLPSGHESFGMSIAEAMACRVPVVITEECHFPDVAGAGAGLVVPRAAPDLARGLAAVLDDPAGARRMGEAGRRLIEERFTWARVARRSLEACGAALGARAVSPG
jgi:glycosyltransferase involved in cell wall biosynthesis